MKPALALLTFLLAFSAAAKQPGARPVLLELFTSQSCSSCPPAEALLAEWKTSDPNILALEFHVDYWNALNWRDPYSSRAATGRQRRYAASLGTEVFTPQLIIDGRHSEVGSDRQAITAAVTAARASQPAGPALAVSTAGSQMIIRVGPGAGAGTLLLADYDESHDTVIPSGENAGTTLHEVNLVRSLRTIGTWQGQATAITAPRPQGQHAAILLQGDDGTVLATALPPAP